MPRKREGGKDPRHELGERGERVAARYLQASGWVLLERNWRCREGELDIIAERGEVLAFVEVRSRAAGSSGAVRAEDSVTHTKQARLARAAQRWLSSQEFRERVLRFDVIAVDIAREGGEDTVRHYANAFEAALLL